VKISKEKARKGKKEQKRRPSTGRKAGTIAEKKDRESAKQGCRRADKALDRIWMPKGNGQLAAKQ